MIHPDIFGVRTLVFDMDGTLIRSSEMAIHALRNGLQEFFARHGSQPPDYSSERLLSGLGAPADEFYRSLLPEKLQHDWKTFRGIVSGFEHDFMHRRRITFPGTHKVLAELKRRGYILALVSNCNRYYLDYILESQNLRRHFHRAVCIGDREETDKTQLVAEVIEKYDHRAVMIGDRFYDVQAAKENRIPCIGALYGYGGREELAETTTWVDSITELLELFNPRRELAERIAGEINRRRENDRALIGGFSAAHTALSARLVPLVISALTELNVPVSHLCLDAHRLPVRRNGETDEEPYFAGNFPWEVIEKELLDRSDRSYLEARLVYPYPDFQVPARIYRCRRGQVLLLEGPALFDSGRAEKFDLRYVVEGNLRELKQAAGKWRKVPENGEGRDDIAPDIYHFARFLEREEMAEYLAHSISSMDRYRNPPNEWSADRVIRVPRG